MRFYYAVVTLAVLSCSIRVDGCTITHSRHAVHVIDAGRRIYCRLLRTDGGNFGTCEGNCFSSAKFDLVVGGDLRDHSRATQSCTGVQNCCKETGTVLLGDTVSSVGLIYDPTYRTSQCAWRDATDVWLSSALSCACNPCKSTTIPPVSILNNDRTLDATTCKT